MTSFNLNEPSSLFGSQTIGMQDVSGLVKAHLQTYIPAHMTAQVGHSLSHAKQAAYSFTNHAIDYLLRFSLKRIPDISFTEIDRAFLVWGAIALAIFSLAQFSSLVWTTQSAIDAALTGLGIVGSAKLTWRLASSERLSWVICLWAVLMASGMIVTAYGIFCGVGVILVNLCALWLGLCALGYFAMGIGLGSRSFSVASVVHAIAIPFLSLHPSHQFLNSGLVMALTLFFFSFVPWDMRASEAEELCGVRHIEHPAQPVESAQSS